MPKSVDEPLGTVTAKNGVGLAEPFVVSHYTDGGNGGGHKPRSVDGPLPTITTANRFGLVEPFIVPQQGDGVASLDDPLQTIMTTSRGVRLIEPCVDDLVVPILEPATEDAPRGRVIEIDGQLYMLDIRFRMLQPKELGRAQGFPDDYIFTGNKSETTQMIGNAVPVDLAQALVGAAIYDLPDQPDLPDFEAA